MNFQKIVVATDFSPASTAALERAAAMAKSAGAELHVIHVVEALMYRGVTYEEPFSPNAHKEERAAAQKAIAEAVEDLGEDHTPASIEIVDGEPRNAIVAHAEMIGADLIVLGSHGRGRFHDFILGSTAGHVGQLASCSVLVVKI